LVANVIPKERRKNVRHTCVASDYPGYWADSSTDLRAGLEIVELSHDRQWADTAILGLELLECSNFAAD
jgi:hypothetical protein